MPPKAGSSSTAKSKPLIPGQASLSGFFNGGRMTAAVQPTPQKKDADKEKDKGPAPEIKQLTEKIRVSGTRSSASPVKGSPASTSASASTSKAGTSATGAKKSNVVADTDDEDDHEGDAKMSSAAEKKKSVGNTVSEAIALDDSSDEDAAPAPKKPAPAAKTTPKRVAPAAKPAAKRKAARSSSLSDADDDVRPPAKAKKSSAASTPARASASKGKSKAVIEDSDSDEEMKPAATTSKRAAAQTIKLDEDEDDDFEMEEVKMAPKPKAAPKKAAAAKGTPKKSTAVAKAEAKAEAEAEKEEQKEKQKAKINTWKNAAAAKAAGPSAPGSKEIPEGKPNCLAGFTLVFTGQLESLSREEATDLAKRYGAKVTTAPSSKTSYVVLGEDAGPSKIKKIKEQRIETLDEDGFLGLIAVRAQGKADPKALEAKAKEEAQIAKAAKELDQKLKTQPQAGGQDVTSMLWTARYAPTDVKSIMGNAATVNKMQDWLESWQKSLKCNFKKPGKNAINTFRALLISGPPGVGKTTSAHIIAKACGYTPIELNASDSRSKKLIESNLKDTINNASLDGWYKGGGKIDKSETADGVRITDRTCLILDEVDGMSGGDRGGVGAINALIRKTKVPIICICNEARSPKLKPFDSTCAKLPFSRPPVNQIRSRIMTIAAREKIKVTTEAVDQLISSAQADIRLVINMLSTWKLAQSTMSFDEAKQHGSANAKPGMHTPFSLYSDLSAPGMFAPTSKKTLNDKAEYYFNDHSIMPLMVQQNYITQQPVLAKRDAGPPLVALKHMQLLAKASESVSDGDLIDGFIHGSQQHWSLMPVHAMASCVRPMSFMYGTSGNTNRSGGPSFGPAFPSWLGQNSKAQRLSRVAVELQARMRLSASGSRFEVREQYIPHLIGLLTKPLIKDGAAGVDDVIQCMDDYYIGVEDREGMLELAVGEEDGEALLKRIPAQTKTALTRTYNQRDHPIAFAKSMATSSTAKKLVGDAAPDTEDVVVEEAEVVSSDEDDDDDSAIKKDRMIKLGKPKGKGKSKAPSKKK